ncbi:sugar-binding transcriptional regulator [Pseudohoeflea sp. DP4N28-3]|uniref:Sugar-binding transcriptional regulator n=2 Tax=Pseudohoeflea coraliihabitans TaxID=2860393 RepID=A0ABS6WLC5_9HYPH|nr:sugar-binding transcriptional regulator [Pseudohoeflea sp. DP4N28-3]
MYFIEQMTQNEIAEVLGIGRVSVVRMLAEARTRQEVKISIEAELTEIIRLERELEKRFGLDEAVVAPISDATADPISVIGAATGGYLSKAMMSGMSVGVGWGRTLSSSIAYIRARPLDDFKAIALLGGVGIARDFNPPEFAWRFAQIFKGDGYLIPAPAVVDSVETKRALIERCGLNDVLAMAEALDAVVVSVGDIDSVTTFYRGGYLCEKEREELAAKGAVGDLLFHFFDSDGRLVDHEINDRGMSVEIACLRKAPLRILTSGGAEKIQALRGAMQLLGPTVFITDEHTARALLKG